MRKLTPKEISFICSAIGICSMGGVRAQSAPMLPEVVIQTCYQCNQYTDDDGVTWDYFNPPPGGGPNFFVPPATAGAVTSPTFSPYNNPHCTSPGDNAAVIQDTITQNEGDDANVAKSTALEAGGPYSNLTGYVPATSANGQLTSTPAAGSGVTMDGVDLSQYLPSTLEAYWPSQASESGLDPNTIFSFLAPFMATAPGDYGPRGQAALTLLESYHDEELVSSQIASYIFQSAYSYVFGTVYNNMQADDFVNFETLPQETQTALMDYAWNAGPNTLRGNGAIATDIALEDWTQLAADLESTGNPRYVADAGLITADIQDGKLPKQGNPC